ncbi:MAG: cation:proton antiporter [Thermodesulfobacteriota bacterium]|jgi:NhaP-type Na+/H+ or K+/H+ antiporter|nr:MAG: cation:proton antiporter [Thermodesulfobacteriota bacterium]
MIIIIVFVALVFLYSLVSRRLERTLVTAPVIFASGGILLILTMPGLQELDIQRASLLKLAELGLVMLLFTDATHINLKTLRSKEKLPLRLLSIGMLLTILLGAVAAHFIFSQLSIGEAGILAAILAPTDAGLGQVIVRSPRVPLLIRQSLDVEAGLNDGLAVPFFMFFIAVSQIGTEGSARVLLNYVFEQLVMGALAGLSVGLIGGLLLAKARRKEWMAESAQQLGLVAIPVLSVFACEPVGGSMFIAAYIAGLAVQTSFRDAGKPSLEFTEGWGQVLDYFVFFLFGLFVALAISQFSFVHILYAILSLTAVRMVPVAIALIGARLNRASILFIGWFGPRGLASIVLGLVFLEEEAHLPGEGTIKLAVMATVMLSIFTHGFTALPGIDLYARKVAKLDASAPEKAQ